MLNYNKLLSILKSKGLNKSDLTRELNLSSRTIAKISKGEALSEATLKKIADYLGNEPSDLYYIEAENNILNILREEKEHKISNGLYHELQIKMTYNSNHIEGSKLDIEQTRLIFETNTINADGILVDDIIETVNHFRAIDYIIDIAGEELSEDIIKKLHLILKSNTKDSTLSWFKVGDYKIRPNVVGGNETTKPKDVPTKIKNLVLSYNKIKNKTLEDIVDFHYQFEKIHPFQDGNGRVGRLITLKECLSNCIIPFIIEDSKKAFYYRGLSEYQREKGYLLGTCLDGQDTFKKLLDIFEIEY